MKIIALTSVAIAVLMTAGMAGVFFAFSNSVMPGLDAVKASTAIDAMQSIDRKIQNPLFLLAFVGAPLVGALAGGLLLAIGQQRAGVLFFVAAGLYLVGALLPTAVINVPMNNELQATAIPAEAAEAARVWAGYSPRWTAWNHVRTVACSASLLVMAWGLYVWGSNA
jgi:uncharacterized membrane protein